MDLKGDAGQDNRHVVALGVIKLQCFGPGEEGTPAPRHRGVGALADLIPGREVVGSEGQGDLRKRVLEITKVFHDVLFPAFGEDLQIENVRVLFTVAKEREREVAKSLHVLPAIYAGDAVSLVELTLQESLARRRASGAQLEVGTSFCSPIGLEVDHIARRREVPGEESVFLSLLNHACAQPTAGEPQPHALGEDARKADLDKVGPPIF